MNDIFLKTKPEIKLMQEGGKKLAQIRDFLQDWAKAGMSLQEIEDKAQAMIEKAGGEPAFARIPSYQWATCLNVNDGFVHGIPNKYVLQEGDVLSIDIGIYYKGFNTDTAVSFQVGSLKDNKKNQAIKKFLEVGRETLVKAIKVAQNGAYVGDISEVIQKEIQKAGFSVSLSLTGHGIGRKLHEAPKIPCFLNQAKEKTSKLNIGTVIAIEVLYLQGKPDTIVNKDGWTICAKDGKITGIFEKTIAISADGSIVLT